MNLPIPLCTSLKNFGNTGMIELPDVHRSDVITIRPMEMAGDKYMEAAGLKMWSAGMELQDIIALALTIYLQLFLSAHVLTLMSIF